MRSINRLGGLDSTCGVNSAEVTVGSPRAERTETYALARRKELHKRGVNSSKFRVRGFRAAIFLSGMGLFSPPLAFTDSCMDLVDHPNKIAALPANGEGITTVTYSAVGGGAGNSVAASAFEAWNAVTSQTGVSFTPASGSEAGDVQVGPNTGTHVAEDGCIGTTARYGYINWGSHFTPDLTTYAADGKLSFEHEIGHLLGMADNATKTNNDIMDPSTKCTPADSGYSWDARAPTTANGTQAGTCQEDACDGS